MPFKTQTPYSYFIPKSKMYFNNLFKACTSFCTLEKSIDNKKNNKNKLKKD